MPTVCIIGAGYAGIHAARTASRAGVDVTIIEPSGSHDLLPRLSGVAAGRRDAGDAWAPIEDLVDATVVRDRVTGINVDGPLVHLQHGRSLTPDAVVVTAGAPPQLPPVPGLDPETAWTLGDAADALRLRTALDEHDRLVVVGGGATGTQLAAEVAGHHPRMAVHLIDHGDRLLGSFTPALGRRAHRILADRGVDVRLDAGVERVDDRGATLADGERLDGLVVWTTGVGAEGNALLPDAAVSEGRLLVDRSLRVSGRVFAAGDVAAHRDLFGNVTAQSAQIALQAGRAAGKNAAAVALGQPTRPAKLIDLGWVVDLGGRGVAQFGPLDVTLPFADLTIPVLHEAIDLRHLWQAGGARGVLRHASGRHRPNPAQLRRAERPALRSVG